jgi:hypothetical protein
MVYAPFPLAAAANDRNLYRNIRRNPGISEAGAANSGRDEAIPKTIAAIPDKNHVTPKTFPRAKSVGDGCAQLTFCARSR